MINIFSLKLTGVIINVLGVAKILAILFVTALGVWQLIVGGKQGSV